MNNIIERINGKIITGIVVSTLAASVGNVHASTINASTGNSTAGPQVSAADYKNAVETAVASPTAGYGNASPSVFDHISNHGLFAVGSNMDIAFDFTVSFGVTAGQAGAWEFRAGTDFGNGGAVFLDGVALGFKSNDMWWDESYGDASQYFDYTASLAAGSHVLKIYGLEHCCDGDQQAQFRAPGATGFTTFSATDGLATTIPEPGTYTLFGISLLAFGMTRRRKP